jgi:hypothetical protein
VFPGRREQLRVCWHSRVWVGAEEEGSRCGGRWVEQPKGRWPEPKWGSVRFVFGKERGSGRLWEMSRGRKGFLVAERSQAPGRREEGKNLMRRGAAAAAKKWRRK